MLDWPACSPELHLHQQTTAGNLWDQNPPPEPVRIPHLDYYRPEASRKYKMSSFCAKNAIFLSLNITIDIYVLLWIKYICFVWFKLIKTSQQDSQVESVVSLHNLLNVNFCFPRFASRLRDIFCEPMGLDQLEDQPSPGLRIQERNSRFHDFLPYREKEVQLPGKRWVGTVWC